MSVPPGDQTPPLPGSLVNWLWIAGPERWERVLVVHHGPGEVEGPLAHHFGVMHGVAVDDVLSGAAIHSVPQAEFDLVLAHGALDDGLAHESAEARLAGVDALVRLAVNALRAGGCLALAHSTASGLEREPFPDRVWRRVGVARAVERRLTAGGLQRVRRYATGPSLRRFDAILPAEGALLAAYHRSRSARLAGFAKAAICRAGLGPALHPVALHVGYR